MLNKDYNIPQEIVENLASSLVVGEELLWASQVRKPHIGAVICLFIPLLLVSGLHIYISIQEGRSIKEEIVITSVILLFSIALLFFTIRWAYRNMLYCITNYRLLIFFMKPKTHFGGLLLYKLFRDGTITHRQLNAFPLGPNSFAELRDGDNTIGRLRVFLPDFFENPRQKLSLLAVDNPQLAKHAIKAVADNYKQYNESVPLP